MPTIAELEATLERLQKEYAAVRMISQSNPGPILERRMIQRSINRVERQLLDLRAAVKNK
jgi:hypothetical protein